MERRREEQAELQDELRALRRRVEKLERRNAELEEARERLQILFEHALDGYYLSDLKGTFVDGNAAAERITGYKREGLIGKSFLNLDLLSAADLARAARLLEKNLLGQSTGPDEFTLTRNDGSQVTVEVRTHPATIGGRRLVLGIARDVSVRKRVEAALHESEERFRDLFDNANDLIQSVTPDGRFQYVNGAWLERLGYSRSEIDGLTLWDVVHPDSREHCKAVFQAVLCGQAVGRVETAFVAKGGERIPVEGNLNCRFRDGQPVATRGIFRDVTERKRFEEKLELMARCDPLTGVFNRYALEELLRLEADRSARYGHSIGFLLIDVNRFKETNDRFGHLVGDKVLREVARVLRNHVRGTDVIVRYGGDEFLVILLETDGETDLVKDRILAEVARRNETNPLLEFPVTLAIGSVHWDPGGGRSLEEVLAEADRMMCEDKRRRTAN